MSTELLVEPEIEQRIKTLAAESGDGKETGGILLGHGPSNDGLIRVTNAGDAGPNAKRRRNFFLRDLQHAKQLAVAAWEDSRAIWVGEWHTHLSGDPRPSSSDLATYARLLLAADLDFESFVSIIATPDPEHEWGQPQLTPWLLSVAEIAGRTENAAALEKGRTP